MIVAAKAVAANIAHSTGTSIVGECCCTTNQIRPVSQSVNNAGCAQPATAAETAPAITTQRHRY